MVTEVAIKRPTKKSTVLPNWAIIRKSFRKDIDAQNADAVKRYWASRDSVASLQSLVNGKKTPPLSWAYFPDDTLDMRTMDLIEKLGPIASGKAKPTASISAELESWLGDLDRRISERNLVLEQLAWLHTLPKLSQIVDEKLWWQALERLIQHASDATATHFSNKVFEQVLAGEFPLTIAYLFPEITTCYELSKTATEVIGEGMQELTDGEGLLAADQFELLRPLLACWTRSLTMIDAMKQTSISKESRTQYDCLVRHALRLTRGDASQTLGNGMSCVYSKPLFSTAVALCQDEDDSAIAALNLPKSKEKPSDGHLPFPSYESSWSRFAYLRPTWQKSSPRLAVRHDEDDLIVELESHGDLLMSGPWNITARANGSDLAPAGDWEQVGWQADDDGDYLELEQPLTENAKLQRLFFLAREDSFLWVQDVLLLEESAETLQLESRPAWQSGIQSTQAEETAEVFLKLPSSKATILPVSIGEWKTERHLGNLQVQENGPLFTQNGAGKALVSCWFFDLSKKKQGKPLTWRSLTVAEKLEIQPRDKAVAYRVQTAGGHWAFYRSTTPKANRTFLGINLISETLIARLDDEGNIEKLLEVEAAT